MFRKSIGFFSLVGLLWLFLWFYIPDKTPNELTFTDLLSGIPLVFSIMAFGFVFLMLTIRYKGIDIASNFIPHAGIIIWLGKHAYQFSQPKVILTIKYIGQLEKIDICIDVQTVKFDKVLLPSKTEQIKLGIIETNPKISSHIFTEPQEIDIIDQIKAIGKNFNVYVELSDDEIKYHQIH